MADEDISQRIVLEGDKEVEASLKAIGDAGKEAFDNLDKSTDGFNKSGATTTKTIQDIEKASFAMGKSIRDVADGIGSIVQGLGGLARVGATVVGAFGAIAKAGANAADEARDQAAALGLTIKEYGRLSFAMRQSGGDINTSRTALNRLTTLINEAAQGNEKASATFRKFGVNIKGNNGQIKSAEQVLSDLSTQFAKMPNGVEKTGLAIELFGARAGPRLIPLLNEGRAGIAALAQDAENLGGVFTEAEGKIGDDFNDALGRLITATSGVVNRIGLALAPAFTEAFNDIATVIGNNRKEIVSLAETVGSVLTAAWRGFKNTVVPILTQFYGILETIVAQINTTFGTNFSAKQLVIAAAFALLTAATLKFAASLLSIIPGATQLLSVLTGIPSVVGLITGSFQVLSGSIGILTNVVRIFMLAFGGWPAIIALVIAALGVLLYQYLSSGLWQAHLNAIIGFFSSTWSQITETFNGFITAIQEGWTALVSWVQENVTTPISTYFSDMVSGISSLISSGIGTLTGYWESFKQSTIQVWNDIYTTVKDVIDRITSAVGAIFGGEEGGLAGGGLVQGFRSGGPVRGRGTGTSDSILARLSNGEYVQTARAVRHYGVDFMNSIRNLSLPRDWPAFATGGIVDVGNVSQSIDFGDISGGGGDVLNLTIGEQQFNGLTGPQDTMDRLKKYAVKRSLSPKKPSWVGRS